LYKLVVSDFDDTLIDKEEAISTNTMIALDRLKTRDILFCVATGRELRSVLDYNRDFSFIDYIVCLNGAYIYDVSLDKVIYKKNISCSIVKKINKLFSAYNLCFCTPTSFYYLNKAYDYDLAFKIDDFSSFILDNKNDIYKIEVHCSSKKQCADILEILEKENLNISYCFRGKRKNYYVEIVSMGIDKLFGIEKICRINKIKLAEVMAFGCDLADLSLLRVSGCGVAMGNGCNDIKKIAREVTVSNQDGGVARIINKYF